MEERDIWDKEKVVLMCVSYRTHDGYGECLSERWDFPENIPYLFGKNFSILDIAEFQLSRGDIEIVTDKEGLKLFQRYWYYKGESEKRCEGIYERLLPSTCLYYDKDKSEWFHTNHIGECNVMLPQHDILKRRKTIYAIGQELPLPDLDELFQDAPKWNDPEYSGFPTLITP